MEAKTWLEVEIEESEALLRKRLEELNNLDADEVDEDVSCEIKNIYKALWYMHQLCSK
jgi:predicted HTH domain antitoxin